MARKRVEEGEFLREIVDSPIRAEALRNQKAAGALLRLAVVCTEIDPGSRPRMRTVCEKLEKVSV